MTEPFADGTTLLIVDDDAVLRERLARAFRKRGFAVAQASNHDEAMATAQQNPPQMAVVDLRMPGLSGLSLLRGLKAENPNIQVVMLTGYGSIATTIEALKLGACYYLQKPADADDILGAFSRGGAPLPERESTDHSVPSLERVKWEHIHMVLSDSGGSISEAARRLHMHRQSLQRILHKRPPAK